MARQLECKSALSTHVVLLLPLLGHTSPQPQHEVKSRLFLNVVIRKSASILELLSGKDESLLVGRDAFLVLDLGLYIVDSVGGFDLEGDGLAREAGESAGCCTGCTHVFTKICILELVYACIAILEQLERKAPAGCEFECIGVSVERYNAEYCNVLWHHFATATVSPLSVDWNHLIVLSHTFYISSHPTTLVPASSHPPPNSSESRLSPLRPSPTSHPDPRHPAQSGPLSFHRGQSHSAMTDANGQYYSSHSLPLADPASRLASSALMPVLPPPPDSGSPVKEETVSPKTSLPPASDNPLTLRALVSTKEAGIIIGKAGATIASIRERTGVKAGVSKVVPGVQDRVFSATGDVNGIASAYGEVATLLLETPLSDSYLPAPPSGSFTSIRLLISHNLMGTVIGRQGLKIKQIQDTSGARMVASKEMLPQSTERVVEVQGAVDAIKTAILEISKCLLEDWERGQGTVQYHPGAGGDAGVLAGGLGAQTVTGPTGGIRRTSLGVGGMGAAPNGFGARRPSGTVGVEPRRPSGELAPNDPNLRTQNISIPSDMVGCIM